MVPNTTYVPETPTPPAAPGAGQRVIYVGHLSLDRGVGEMIDLAALLRRTASRWSWSARPTGRPGRGSSPRRPRAWSAGPGFVPNDQAMPMIDGAVAGLSLLQDEPNFRHSMPTKVVEYMARGVPVVTTPLPAAVELVTRHECGLVVPFGDARAAADAVLQLAGDASLRAKMGSRGHEAARGFLGWPTDARAFVAELEAWAKVP